MSFCEEIHTTEEYHEIRRMTDDYIWRALYMQEPVESKGLLYPIDELKRFSKKDIAKKNSDGIIGYVDTADKGSDYLCALIGKRFGEYTYITDVLFTQDGVEYTEPLVAQMLLDTNCDRMKIEANAGGESFARNVRNLVKSSSGSTIISTETSTTNKETRMLMATGYAKEFIYFRNDYEEGSDYDKFMRQLTTCVKLSKNRHDDAPDALTGLVNFTKTFHIKHKKAENKKSQWEIYEFYENKEESMELDKSYIHMTVKGRN
jgi:predicted phage terminase large subunit-like protein